MPHSSKIKPESLDAVVLISDKYKEQVAFYRDILGLKLVADYGDAVSFAIGDQKLTIFARSHHPEGTKRLNGARRGISHLEFGIGKNDIDAVMQRLKEAGAEVEDDNFEDADGNLFHFNLRKSPAK
jgi:catechol 2,3-dioxygenase-like lactoylglutathione lyase family enzyme